MRYPVKCRIYPNQDQKVLINKTFGCVRWVYNRALALKKSAYDENKTSIDQAEMMRQLTAWKGEFEWLREMDSVALQQSIRNLFSAYANFFRNAKQKRVVSKKKTKSGHVRNPYGHPQFKSKRASRQSYRTQNPNGNVIVVDESHVKLPKLGVLRVRGLRMPDGRITSATVTKLPSGRYELTLLFDDVPDKTMPPPASEHAVGVDVGISSLMTTSDGVEYKNPKALAKRERQLKRAQRVLDRRQGARRDETPSKNYLKQKRKVARIHERIANARADAKHKATTDVVRSATSVFAETLDVKDMLADHEIAKAASDAAMSETIRQLEYKCSWYGREFFKVDKWYPSSKMCHVCGFENTDLDLSERSWTCPSCGTDHARDLNAAINIREEGVFRTKGTVGHTGTWVS